MISLIGIVLTHLGVGKERVKSAVSEIDAVDQLVQLIQEEGKWIDP